MSLRLYLFSLYAAAIISFGLWLILVVNVNPMVAPNWIIAIFYISLYCFISSVLAISGFYVKVWAVNREIIFAHLAPTLRQSMIVSFVLIGLLFLQQVRVLNWWTTVIFIAASIMIELFFRTKKS